MDGDVTDPFLVIRARVQIRAGPRNTLWTGVHRDYDGYRNGEQLVGQIVRGRILNKNEDL
jgi:hypothetical protein